MAQVLRFPGARSIAPVRIRSGSKHAVSVWIVDQNYPEETRWHMQFPIQRAGSFRALKGFTDKLAQSGELHTFQVGRTFRIRRFLREIEELILHQRIIVKIDGTRVQAKAQKRA